MTTRKYQILTLALLFCAVAVAPGSQVSARKLQHYVFGPGEVIVKLKPSTHHSFFSGERISERLARLEQLATEAGIQASDATIEPLVPSIGGGLVGEIVSSRGLDRVFVLKFDPSVDLLSVIQDLASREDVEYAEPNYRVKLGTLVPNDPDFSLQWALSNPGYGIDNLPATPNADIKAGAAWSITTGSSDVIVAVTDTGVDLTHPDLAANIYTNPGEIAGNGIDDDRNGYVDDVSGYDVALQTSDTTDIVGHGTQMAGLIAAEINNLTGIAGVSQSRIMSVRFFERTGDLPDEFDATVADAARSLVYSIAAGASIINASWVTYLLPGIVPVEESQALRDAVKATDDAGVLLVTIAGNEGFNNDASKIYPAAYQTDNLIVVAASDYNDEMWHPPFDPYHLNTGFGKKTVHLAAPGVSVLTTRARGNCAICSKSEEPQDWYGRADGTSVSAALVAGVAALVKSKYPQDNAIILKRRILAGVEVLSSLEPYVITGGRLNAAGALTAEVTSSHPTIERVKYKAGKEKLFVYGTDLIQNGLKVIIGNTGYTAKKKADGFMARVPKSALPSGVAVNIRVRNTDGGESQPFSFTR